MDYVRWDAKLSAMADDKSTVREHLEMAAKAGSSKARRELEEPERPEALEYLWRWAQQLHGRSGAGQFGLVPLTWTTLHDWAETTRVRLEPLEIEALMILDNVMLHPEAKA